MRDLTVAYVILYQETTPVADSDASLYRIRDLIQQFFLHLVKAMSGYLVKATSGLTFWESCLMNLL